MRACTKIIGALSVSASALVVCSANSMADFKVAKIGDTVVDTNALTIKGHFGPNINGTSFQQEAIVTHGEHQYVGYYDGKRRVCIARRKLPAGKWEIVRFTDYHFKSNDSHNTISLGVCPADGTIHLAFDHHNAPLHYRVSQKGVATKPEEVRWDASLFGPIKSELEKGRPVSQLCYPRFWQTPQRGLQFCYRWGYSGNGNRMLVDYLPETGTWLGTRQIDSGKGQFGNSDSRCSYPNGYTYGPGGRLHATWVWRETGGTPNHDLMYAYSEDKGKTWLNNQGLNLDEPAHVGSPGITVVSISSQYGLMNTHGQAVDSQGRIHVVMWHCTEESLEAAGSKPGQTRWGPEEARRYHHYWRDEKATWHHNELPWMSGTRPKLFMDKNDNAFLIYSTRTKLYSTGGNLIIASASAASKWADWKIVYEEEGPFVNEMLGDPYRWKKDGILSIMVQGSPEIPHEATPLHILDFTLEQQ